MLFVIGVRGTPGVCFQSSVIGALVPTRLVLASLALLVGKLRVLWNSCKAQVNEKNEL